jgi:hypothetical protein
MKLAVFCLVLWVLPLFSFSQPNQGLNAELQLRSDLIFGKKVIIEGESVFTDGYLLEAEVKDHAIFDHMGVIHDDRDQLTEYYYSCGSEDKTFKNKEKILSSIEKYFETRSKPDSDENGVTWSFRKGDDFATFNILKNQCTLTLSTNSLIKAKEEFDSRRRINIITVSGLVINHHEYSAMGNNAPSEYLLYFEGLKEKKAIVMRINPTYRDCKFLRFVFSDSTTFKLAVTRRQYIGHKEYDNELELPRELADKLYKSSEVSVQTTGELGDQIIIPARVFRIFKVIYEYLYR